MRTILIVSDTLESINDIRSAFSSEYLIDRVFDKNSALKTLGKKRYDFLFIDLNILLESTQNSGFSEALHPFKSLYPSIEIVVVSSQDMIRQAVKFVKAGACDYLTHPISPDEVKLVIETVEISVIKQSELDYLRDQYWELDSIKVVQTKNPVMQEVFKKIQLVAPTKTTVLFSGETGTGKGVLSKLVHQHSNRPNAQFISVHCGAIPDTLLESELFGHEKGSFTGAVRKKLGKFEIAKGGTIFLDEVGTITPSAQIKLLQVLQDSTFSRVGGEETIKTNARVIAATNSDLKEMCDAGKFRKDLYYRLQVFPIDIPPLRERIEDLPFLIEVFLDRLNKEFQKDIHSVHPQVIEALAAYEWPGNIRELENLMERAYILENSSILTPESFPVELFTTDDPAILSVNFKIPLAEARNRAIDDFERQYIKELISRNKGKINKSAEEAGISTRQLHKLMTKYGIRKEEYKA